MTRNTQSKSNTATSQKESRGPGYFALLAKAGHNKRKLLALHEEAEFYSTIATELLAHLVARRDVLLQEEAKSGHPIPELIEVTSLLTQQLKRTLSFWPNDTESQSRILALLESSGLETLMIGTGDGFVTPSSDLILGNVVRIIAHTKEQRLKL